MTAAGAYDEIEEVNANCTFKDNLQQASILGTQTDSAPIYDLDISAQKQQGLYNGKVLLEKHDPPAVYDSEETLELAQEIILNGDSLVPTKIIEGVRQPVAPTTAKQKLARNNELKARGTLLMALPNKHQLKFNSHKDAKTLMEAIEKRFEGNTETKKRNKADLEEQVLMICSTVLRFMKLSVSTVCAKMHVSSSLPNVDSLSNAVIYSFFASESSSPQLDNKDLKQIDVDDLEEMDLRWKMAMLTMRARRFLQKTGKNLGANRPTSIGFDMSKVECYNCNRKGHFARECRSSKDSRRNSVAEPQRRTIQVETSTSNALVSQCDGAGSYDWSYEAEEEPANYALMAFSSSSSSSDNEVSSCSKAYAQLHSQYDKLTDDFRKSQFDVISYQTSLESVKARLLVYKQNESVFEENIKLLNIEVQLRDNALVTLRQKLEKAEQERESDCESCPPTSLYDRFQPSDGYHLSPTKPEQAFSHTNRPTTPIIEDWVSDSDDESETKALQIVPSFVQSFEQVKSPTHSVQHVETSIPVATSKPASPKSGSSGKRRNRKACFVCKSLDYLIKDCDYHAKKMAQPTTWNHVHMVLTQSKPVSFTAVRPVSAVVPKIKGTRPSHANPIITKTNSPFKRHITHSPSPKTSNSPPRVTAVKASVGNPQHALKDKGVIDSGCSRNMTWKMSYHFDFEELNGGYVAFGGNPKGGKISGKGKIKTVTDDYSRFTWVFFLATKDETTPILKTFITGLENQLSLKVKIIRSDNGTEFKNHDLNQFYRMKGIKREFSVPRTPQQNGIAERKNRTLIKAARIMLADSLLPIPFWNEAVNTACYVQNRVLVTKPHNKTPYELLHGRTLSIGFMRPFGCFVTILNTLDSLGNFKGVGQGVGNVAGKQEKEINSVLNGCRANGPGFVVGVRDLGSWGVVGSGRRWRREGITGLGGKRGDIYRPMVQGSCGLEWWRGCGSRGFSGKWGIRKGHNKTGCTSKKVNPPQNKVISNGNKGGQSGFESAVSALTRMRMDVNGSGQNEEAHVQEEKNLLMQILDRWNHLLKRKNMFKRKNISMHT
nr:putative ribonuclease H-like domain-containing protein [Tanacetum cinerariifolium]